MYCDIGHLRGHALVAKTREDKMGKQPANSKLQRVCGSLSVLAIALPALASAQATSSGATSAEVGQGAIEDIVVTARRTEERLQDTPIAVTALTARALEARGLQNIAQINDFVPNLQFFSTANVSGSTSAATVFIRGIGQTDFAPTTEPGVGIYLDGVYIARSVGSVLDLADIERVEVLRGPQGTLFGKNTIGGAINVTTVKPNNTLGGRLEITGGRFNRIDAKGSINVPITETLFVRLTAASLNRDGYARRILATDTLGGKNTLAGRLSVLWAPSSTLEYRVDLDGSRIRGESAATTLLGVNSINPGAPVIPILNSTLPPAQQYTFANYATNDPYTTRGTGPNRDDVDVWGISGTGTWTLGDSVNLRSITAYRDLKSNFGRDADNSPLLVVHTLDRFDQWQFSQELQLTGKSLDDRLNWIIGAFYFKEKAVNVNQVPLAAAFGNALGIPTAATGATTIRSGGSVDNDNFAGFGQGTFKFTDQFSVTAGLRYSYEKKRFLPDQFIEEARAAGQTTNPAIGPVDPLIFRQQVSITTKRLDPKISLEYKINQRTLLYGSFSTGYKGGGFVQRIFPGRPTTAPSFGDESVNVYEVGLKTQAADNRVRFNTAAFWTDYKNLQVTVLLPGEFGPRTINAGKARIRGIEAELEAVPTRGLNISAGLGYTDASYRQLPPTAQGLTLQSRLPNTSEWTLNGSVNYSIPLDDRYQVDLHGDWSYRSSAFLAAVNTPNVLQPGYHLANGSVMLNAHDRWSLQAGVRNIFDQRYLTGANDELGGLGYAEGTFAPPRECYVTARVSF